MLITSSSHVLTNPESMNSRVFLICYKWIFIWESNKLTHAKEWFRPLDQSKLPIYKKVTWNFTTKLSVHVLCTIARYLYDKHFLVVTISSVVYELINMKKRRKLHNQNHILASNFDERENQLRHPHFPSLCNRAIFNKFSFKMLPGLSIYLVSLAPSGLLLPSVMYEVVTRGLTEPIDFCQQSRYSHCRLLSYPSLCNFAMFP